MTAIYSAFLSLGGETTETLEAALADTWLPEGHPGLQPGHVRYDDSTLVVVSRGRSTEETAVRLVVDSPDGEQDRLVSTATLFRDDEGCQLWLECRTEGPGEGRLRGPSQEVLNFLTSVARQTGAPPGEYCGNRLFAPDEDFASARPLVLLIGRDVRLEREVASRVDGMATVRVADLPQVGLVQRSYPDMPIVSAGAVLVFREGHSPLLLPPTLVSRQLTAAAARVQRACLDEALARSTSTKLGLALALPGMPNSGSMPADDALLDDAVRLEDERTQAREEAADLRIRYDDLVVELVEALHQVEDSGRRLRFVERRLAEAGDFAALVAGEDAEELEWPASCVEALERAREELEHITITGKSASARDLDRRPESLAWAQKAWMSLRSLDDYARLRAQGEVHSNFLTFCADPVPGALTINPSWIALGESEATRNDPICRAAREFPVPVEIRAGGRAFMEAHIKIQRVGTPAPRMHYLDDSPRSGQVLVGYLGPHLPLSSG